MNNFKKVLSLLLCVLMITASVSCSDNAVETENPSSNNDTSTSSEAQPETLAYLDDLPDNLDFDGTKIRFVVQNDIRSIYVDEEEDDIADIVIEAVWKRNNAIEDRLNIEFEVSDPIGYSGYNEFVMKSIQANSDDYDVFQGHARFQINLASLGAMKNLDNIENLDLKKEYWGQDYINNISYKDIHYWATGELSLQYVSYIYCIIANNDFFNQLYPGQKLYDYVNEGKWTLDTFESLISKAYIDYNGNGKTDIDDRFGTWMHDGHVFNGMMFASNIAFTKWDSDGIPSVGVDDEHTYSVLEHLGKIFKDNPSCYMASNNDTTNYLEMFVQQKILFYPNTLGAIEDDLLRNMNEDFCLLPYPKFDEAQENYRCSQYDGVPLYGIPITANFDNLPAIGATLEAMCSLSSRDVLPVYYDDALKSKYSRDPETAQMIDLITSSVVSDFSFSWADTVGKYGSSLQNYFCRNIGSKTLASKIAKNEKLWEKGMDELLDALDEYADN